MGKQIVRVKRKRSLKLSGLLGLLAFVSVFAFCFTAVVVKTSNTGLARQIQDTQKDIKIVRDENEALTAEVEALQNYNRVVGIANDAGYDLRHDSTLTIKSEE